jgi:DNA replication and repair protein RecF
LVVKNLEANGFRNLINFSVSFQEGKNLIFGGNGSGKTSVIEAIFLLGFGKSFLPVGRKEMVNFNAPGFFLSAELLNKSGENRLSARQEKNFCLCLNGEKSPLAQVSQYLYPLFFSHFNYNLAIDYATHFRRMIDRFIFGLSSLYLHDILRYNTTLRQKNCLLKNLGKTTNNSELNSWNQLLAEAGNRVIKRRMGFIDQLNRAGEDQFGPGLTIGYFPSLPGAGASSASGILEELERFKGAEIRAGRALVGPQRDRFVVTVSSRNLQLFSSGEKKKYLLMIHMAFIELFRQTRNEPPVFLIDDYDAALDEENLEFLLEHFPAMQVIATSVARNEKFGHWLELKKEN